MPQSQPMQPVNSQDDNNTSRRSFIKTSAATMVGTGMAVQQAIANGAFAKENNILRVGLIGCGGRGTGAAAQALRADSNTQLVALADAFPDQLQKHCKVSLRKISKIVCWLIKIINSSVLMPTKN